MTYGNGFCGGESNWSGWGGCGKRHAHRTKRNDKPKGRSDYATSFRDVREDAVVERGGGGAANHIVVVTTAESTMSGRSRSGGGRSRRGGRQAGLRTMVVVSVLALDE